MNDDTIEKCFADDQESRTGNNTKTIRRRLSFTKQREKVDASDINKLQDTEASGPRDGPKTEFKKLDI